MKALRFFRHTRAADSEVSGGIPPKFEFIQALMHDHSAVKQIFVKNDHDEIGIFSLFDVSGGVLRFLKKNSMGDGSRPRFQYFSRI